MATVFKPKGRRRYYIAYRDGFGNRVTKSSGTSDKQAAERIANKIEAESALRREGVIDVRLEAQIKEASKPMKGVIAGFEASMIALGRNEKHIASTVKYIEAIVADCGFSCLQDVRSDGVTAFANRLSAAGRSQRTIGAYLQAVKHLTRWAMKTGKIPFDPLASISKPQADADPKRIRRYLNHEEWGWLESSTRAAASRYGMTGQERAVLYGLAIQTGLRASECRSLTRGKLHLTDANPFVLASAEDTKNKKLARQYIKPDLAAELQNMVRTKTAGAAVFAIPDRLAEMLREDLAEARSAWLRGWKNPQERMQAEASDFLRDTDSQGHKVDFHSLRHTCATWLIQSGADVKTVQAIMRHSDIKLTLQRYGHLFPGAEAEAIKNLRIDNTLSQAAKATGTHGKATVGARAGASARGAKGCELLQNETGQARDESDSGTKKSQAKRRGNQCFPMKNRNAPARTRTLDPLIKSQRRTNENIDDSDSAQPGAHISQDHELAEVVSAWADLPLPLRSAIVHIVRSVGDSSRSNKGGS